MADAGAIKAAVDAAPVSGPEAHMASRQLALWRKQGHVFEQGQEALIRMYLGVKSVACTDGSRMSASMFKGWTKTLSRTISLKRKLWIVPRQNQVWEPNTRFRCMFMDLCLGSVASVVTGIKTVGDAHCFDPRLRCSRGTQT
jgi:hypothetical protein